MVGRKGVSRRTAHRTTRRVANRQAARSDVGGGDGEQAPLDQTPPEQAAAAPAEDDRYATLKEAKELLDAGILIQEEFDAEKKKILG